MRVTCPAHLTFLDLITLIIFGEKHNYEAPQYVVFSIPLLLPASVDEIYFSVFFLIPLQSMFFPYDA
jgi:hypothetical protein